jgi:hypothetical protein
MDALDVMLMASMGALVVLFAGLAMVDWRDAAERRRANQRSDATVIRRPSSDRRMNPAA